jgi:hypothetical protein
MKNVNGIHKEISIDPVKPGIAPTIVPDRVPIRQ